MSVLKTKMTIIMLLAVVSTNCISQERYFRTINDDWVNTDGDIMLLPEDKMPRSIFDFGKGFVVNPKDFPNTRIEMVNRFGEKIDFLDSNKYSVQRVSDDFIQVEHNGLIGLMDWNLNWITEPEYERIERFYDGYAFAVKDGVEVILDTNGTVIVEDIGRFKKIRPKTVVTYSSDLIFMLVSIENAPRVETAYINSDGDFLIDWREGLGTDFREGYAVFQDKQRSEMYYIDTTGSKAEHLPTGIYLGDFHEGLAVFTENGKMGYVDLEGNIVIPAIYDFASDFSGDYAAVTEYEPQKQDVYLMEEKEGIMTQGQYYIIDRNGDRQGEIAFSGIPKFIGHNVCTGDIYSPEDGLFHWSMYDIENRKLFFTNEQGMPNVFGYVIPR
jgi:hypothetical protein